jgi:MoaA/NifB/PqqE/SkfB family radical SAM enzyme
MAVSLLGGEVLLREDLGDVIGVLVAGGVAVRITTNGRLVPSRAHVLDGVSCVKMSLDGPRDVHDALRGEGAFAAVLEAVQACRQRGIRVQVNTVLTRRLLPRLDEHLETASRLGARVTFQVPELRAGAAARDLAGILPDPDRLREALAKLAGHVQGGDRRIGSSEGTLRYMLAWPEMEPVDCWAGLLFCRVLVDGSIRACDRTYAPVPAGRTLARVGPCRGCYRNNTIEINRAVAGGLDALRALARLL